MKIAYLDCFAGASGDMILGALLDAGVPLEGLQAELARLDVGGYRLQVRRVTKCGVSATKVDVVVEEHGHHHRPLRRILELLDRSDLTSAVGDLARRIFRRLGEAEGRVHGVPAGEVHFHEVGATDAIVDIVGAAAGFRLLEADRVVISPIHLGRGFVRTAHGLYPIPAPATAYLLEGLPVYSTEVAGELTTPTGAAILAEVADEAGPLPPMALTRVGYGAGAADREMPNVLRLLVGESAGPCETVTELAANIDDMNPQLYDHLMTRLLGAGALDVWLSPVQMKKNRPAVVVQALARPADADRLAAIILAESTTLGVRRREVQRTALEREVVTVDTAYGPVRVKMGRGPGGQPLNAAPEYEDCLALAAQHGVPLKLVYAAALGAGLSPSGRSGSLPGPPLR